MPSVSVILPILNEEDVIEDSVNEILEKLPNYFERFEIIAVNDGSTDNTAHILKNLQKQDKRIKVLTHRKNKGYGAVIKTGLEHAKNSWIFFTDSDLQFNVGEIRNYLVHMDSNDFIVGFRKKRADPWKRKFVSKIYNRVIRLFFGLSLRDVDCAFKLMRRSSLERVNFKSNSFFVSVEIMVKANKLRFRIKEIGVNHFPRRKGISKVTLRQVFFALGDLFKLYMSFI